MGRTGHQRSQRKSEVRKSSKGDASHNDYEARISDLEERNAELEREVDELETDYKELDGEFTELLAENKRLKAGSEVSSPAEGVSDTDTVDLLIICPHQTYPA
jgi:phage shock protein A